MSRHRLAYEDFLFIENEKELKNDNKYHEYSHFMSSLWWKDGELVHYLHIEWGLEVHNKEGDKIEAWWDKTSMVLCMSIRLTELLFALLVAMIVGTLGMTFYVHYTIPLQDRYSFPLSGSNGEIWQTFNIEEKFPINQIEISIDDITYPESYVTEDCWYDDDGFPHCQDVTKSRQIEIRPNEITFQVYNDGDNEVREYFDRDRATSYTNADAHRVEITVIIRASTSETIKSAIRIIVGDNATWDDPIERPNFHLKPRLYNLLGVTIGVLVFFIVAVMFSKDLISCRKCGEPLDNVAGMMYCGECGSSIR